MKNCCARWTNWMLVPVALLSLSGWLRAEDGKRKPKSEATQAAKQQAETTAEQQYWIGISGTPVDPLLKTHLRIDAGVVVQHVVPDSPAAKAGIKQDDIVLKFGDAQATDPPELSKAVNENKDRAAKVTLLQAGKKTVVEVTPATRPAESWVPDQTTAPWKQMMDDIKQLQKGLQEGRIGEEPFKMFFLRPGLAVPEGWKGRLHPGIKWQHQWSVPMPKNMSVSVTKVDDGPAQVVVKQGDKTWEVKENELDKLPEDVRKVVQGMLGGHGAPWILGGEGLRIALDAQGVQAEAGGKAKSEPAEAAGQTEKEMDGALKRLEEARRDMQENQKRLQKEMEKLRQQMEELKKQTR